MRSFVADYIDQGMQITVQFHAADYIHASTIANRKGWNLLGEYYEDCPADVAAMIELRTTGQTVH